MRDIKVSLVTTVFNEAGSIAAFIESINRQSVKPDELIIVDGGSQDNTVDLIRRHISPQINLRLIVDGTCNRKHLTGPIARGRNIAVQNAVHDYILVTDAGCILSENWVEEMKGTFSGHDCDIVAGWYTAKEVSEFQRRIAGYFCPPVENIDGEDFLPSSRSVGFKKSIWAAAGGYPENSYTAEDTVFDLRMFSLTEKKIFNDRAVVYWTLPGNFREFRKKLVSYGEGEGMQGLFIGKYVSRLFYVILFPISIIYALYKRKGLLVYFYHLFMLSGFIKGSLKRVLSGSERA